MQSSSIVELIKPGDIIELFLPKKVTQTRLKNFGEYYDLPSKNSRIMFLGEEMLVIGTILKENKYGQFLKFLHNQNIIYLFKPWCHEFFTENRVRIVSNEIK